MIISEKLSFKRIINKKIDHNTFEIVDVYALSHPECPIVIINGTIDVIDNQQSEKLKVIEGWEE